MNSHVISTFLAWGAFVGLFLARISRGRTIRQVVVTSFLAPLFFSFLWFCTFGGIGLRQARQGMELEALGETYFEDPAHFRQQGSDFCYDVPQNDVVFNGTTIFTNNLIGITPVCQFDSSESTQAWFNVMYSFSYPEEGFGGFGGFLSGLSIFAVTVYFVTSSDSGSLIVDHLASNGHEHHHWLQRVFWAFTEGAVATALLVSGGSDALSALQAASIVFGLPFNLFLFAMMYCTVQMCAIAEQQDKDGDYSGKLPEPDDTSFAMPIFGGVFNIMEYIVSCGQVHEARVARGMDLPSSTQCSEFVIGLFLPMVSVYKVLTMLEKGPVTKMSLTLAYTAFFILWIALFASASVNFGFVAFAFASFFINGCILTGIRMEVREKFNLDGGLVGDYIASSFFYMQTLCQLVYQFEVSDSPSEIVDTSRTIEAVEG
jgi:Cys-rich protein (TIGR01571 family)